MAISLNNKHKIKTSVKDNQLQEGNLTIVDFLELHASFINDKRLENLAQRTIDDHIYIFSFFERWIKSSYWFDTNQYDKAPENQCVSRTIFNNYKEYMIYDKEYAPCTVNIRLRPIKTFITWLYNNKYLIDNLNHFIKLVKVDDERIRPLSSKEVKKLLNTIGESTYARFRDSIISITILDCGIRINELLHLKGTDINQTDSFITVRASVSKTRTERILPISKHTVNLLTQLQEIAQEYGHDYLFLSTTEMVKKGVDIFTLQRMMGHKNITTTRQYVHIDNKDILAKHKDIGLLNNYLV